MCGCMFLRVRRCAFTTTKVTDTSPSKRLKRDEEGQWQEPANKHVKTPPSARLMFIIALALLGDNCGGESDIDDV